MATGANLMKVYTGAVWIVAASSVFRSSATETFTASAGQTSFVVSGGYDVGRLTVYRNGLRLIAGTGFTAGNGTTLTLGTPALTGDLIEIEKSTHSDTATLEVDDSGVRIVLPQIGAPVVVALGWEGEGLRTVFTGTVDEVRSSGSRSGRTLNITAKGVDTTAKPKEPQQRHFDGKTVEDILKAAGKTAGITEIDVDPGFKAVRREYLEMRDESFIHMGARLLRTDPA